MTESIVDLELTSLRRTARLAGRVARRYVVIGQQAGCAELPLVQALDHVAEDLLALSSHLSLLAATLEHTTPRLAERISAS